MRTRPLICTLVLGLIVSACLVSPSPASPAPPGQVGDTPPPQTGAPGEPATAPEPQTHSIVSGTWSLSLASRYLFQGIDYSDGRAVLNPELGVTVGPISAKLWGNHDLDQNVSNEHDFSVYRDWSLPKLSLTTGYTYLWYPHREGWDPSQELYVDISREGVLNPSLSVHYDFDSGKGTYTTFGVSHGFERPIGTISVGTNLFYQNGYYDQTGIPSIEWNMNLSRSFGKFSVTPSVSRFLAWENGYFRDENAVKSAWLFSLSLSQDL